MASPAIPQVGTQAAQPPAAPVVAVASPKSAATSGLRRMLGVLRRHLTLGVSIGVVVTWMLASTGSLLLAVPMHASYAGWLLMLIPATSFEELAVWQTTLAAALLLVVAVVIGVVGHHGHHGHPGRAGAYGGHSRG